MNIKFKLLSVAAFSLVLGACTSNETANVEEVKALPIVKTAKVYAE